MRPGARIIAAIVGVPVVGVCLWASDALSESFEGSPGHPAIGYGRPPDDAVAALNRKIQEGSAELKYDEGAGYLRSVLEALNVPVESQIVAMAKTSVQRQIITPQNPRTLYFNDSVAVGFVRGGFIELAAQDPKQGFIFYTLGRNGPRPQPFQDRRLFRYPCSYMIYSEAFDGLPGEAKKAIYERLWSVLSGSLRDQKYARFSLADRRAVVEILRETKSELPDYFSEALIR